MSSELRKPGETGTIKGTEGRNERCNYIYEVRSKQDKMRGEVMPIKQVINIKQDVMKVEIKSVMEELKGEIRVEITIMKKEVSSN